MTAVPPAQAAHDAFSGAEAYQCMMGNPSWETITETYRLIWRFAAWAAFEAARAPESYSRPELRLGECPLHPAQREVQVRSRGEWLCLRQFLDLHEQPQPAPDFRALIRDNLIPEPAPELAAAMAESRRYREALEQVAKHHDNGISAVRVIAKIAKRALEAK